MKTGKQLHIYTVAVLPKAKRTAPTRSSMATKLVNWDRMEYSLLNSMMKRFSSAFFPCGNSKSFKVIHDAARRTSLRPHVGSSHTIAPRVQLRPSPGSRLQNPGWALSPWACEETEHKNTDNHHLRENEQDERKVLYQLTLKGSSVGIHCFCATLFCYDFSFLFHLVKYFCVIHGLCFHGTPVIIRFLIYHILFVHHILTLKTQISPYLSFKEPHFFPRKEGSWRRWVLTAADEQNKRWQGQQKHITFVVVKRMKRMSFILLNLQ